MNITAQVLGLLAIIGILSSYQQVKKEKYLFVQGVANIFFAVQYLLLNAYSAVGSNLIAILRSFAVYGYEKKNKKAPIWLMLIIELFIITIGVFTYKDIYSLIPILIASLYTIGVTQKKLEVTYFIGLVAAILWIFYNYMVGAYVASLGSIFEFLSALIGIIKVIKYGNKKRRNTKKCTR